MEILQSFRLLEYGCWFHEKVFANCTKGSVAFDCADGTSVGIVIVANSRGKLSFGSTDVSSECVGRS